MRATTREALGATAGCEQRREKLPVQPQATGEQPRERLPVTHDLKRATTGEAPGATAAA